jgi:putative heme-binding domain-containing protein
LLRYDLAETAPAIISRYPEYDASEKQVALQTLAARDGSAKRLLEAMEAGKIPTSDVTAFTARQLRSLRDDEISTRLSKIWGNVRTSPRDRQKQIDALGKMLSPDILAHADLSRGALLFKKHCANCHRFFGDGGAVGPDITGAQRINLSYLLENIIDPSASVAKEYRMQVIRTIDGRVISGLVESESQRSVTIVNASDKLVIPRDEIEEQKRSDVSVMPTGLLDSLGEHEIRDLMGYLQR